MSEPVPSFHYPCGYRTVIVGKWGHQLAHPSNCPACAELRRTIEGNR